MKGMSFKAATAALLASSAVAALSAAQPAAAQQAAAPAPAAAEEATLGEIVVTARRRAESLQEVPQTVNAVTADTIGKLNITQFADLTTVVPGLSLTTATDGINNAASLRGVTFNVKTGAPLGTVGMYIDDAPVQAQFLFSSLFDVGQIEVLRGPQGATRGVSAPSGAMTLTTRKPNLSEFGGYIDGTISDQNTRNAQGAINVPIIKDVLAVRISGLVDDNDLDGVRSIHNAARQSNKTTVERISVNFEPSDLFDAGLVYEHLDQRFHQFDQVSGPGHSGPGAFVDPPISPFDRAAVEDGISDMRIHQDIVVANIDSRIFGQHLSYVGSYQNQKEHYRAMGPVQSDMGDIIPGVEIYNTLDNTLTRTTQELRVSSDPAPNRFFDYSVGANYTWQSITGGAVYPGPLLTGSFGPPGGVNLAAYNPKFTAPIDIAVPSTFQETSIFGSLTLHLGENTELTGGMRHMWTVTSDDLAANIGNGLLALPPPLANVFASILGGTAGCGPSATYPGFCDASLPIPGLTQKGGSHGHTSETPNIYTVSLSHHFTRDLLVYANTGTSFRSAFGSPGIRGPILTSTDPMLAALVLHPSERSRSYELGVKWTFLDGRARLNADVYRQRFHNFTLYVPHINFIGASGPDKNDFTSPVDALAQGFELDSALQITREWNVNLQYSYSDGKVEGSLVPCNTFDAAGNPTFNHTYISFCPGASSSRLPYWNLALTSEYNHQVANNVDGFIRGLFTYYPENKNRMEPNFTVPSYGLLNLYAGLRSQDGIWEVSLFAKNALENKTVLDKSPASENLNSLLGVPAPFGYAGVFPRDSGYFQTQITPRREVGINVRYAFGSR